MREIKFRGRTISGKWVYGDFFKFSCAPGCCFIGNDTGTYQVVPESVGQYTGLKDKNGREIYEGDIVTDGSLIGNVPIVSYKATIEFKDGCWKQTNSNCDCGECCDAILFENYKELEVIVNIYENPELMK